MKYFIRRKPDNFPMFYSDRSHYVRSEPISTGSEIVQALYTRHAKDRRQCAPGIAIQTEANKRVVAILH